MSVNTSDNTSDIEDWNELGHTIRERRRALSLTLVELAAQVGLSQPFLSQIENGRARPSLMSLHRIAEALGTTPQAFFGGPIDLDAGPVMVRSDTVRELSVGGVPAESTCHVLLSGDAPFHLVEFDGLPNEFLDYFTHDGFEATYVISGRVEIDIAGDVTELGPGDSISYSSRLPHRHRSLGKRRASMLLVETKIESIKDSSAGSHSPGRATGDSGTGEQRPA